MSRRRDEMPRAFRIVKGNEELAVLSIPLRSPSPPPSLSSAEQEVCALILEGRSNAEIAAVRRSAIRTVANQIASIFRKLGVSSRAELAARLAGSPEQRSDD